MAPVHTAAAPLILIAFLLLLGAVSLFAPAARQPTLPSRKDEPTMRPESNPRPLAQPNHPQPAGPRTPLLRRLLVEIREIWRTTDGPSVTPQLRDYPVRRCCY
jgi:hypothetical protein